MAVAQNREMSAVGSVLFLTVLLGTVSQVLGFWVPVAHVPHGGRGRSWGFISS